MSVDPAVAAQPEQVTLDDLVAAAARLIDPARRRILGITGAPGAGKSTVAEALVTALAPDAVLVGMDGFHLRDDELRRLGRHERKGAPDTFDAAGYTTCCADCESAPPTWCTHRCSTARSRSRSDPRCRSPVRPPW